MMNLFILVIGIVLGTVVLVGAGWALLVGGVDDLMRFTWFFSPVIVLALVGLVTGLLTAC